LLAELLARLLPGAVGDPISPTTTLLCILPLRACCKTCSGTRAEAMLTDTGKRLVSDEL
jgi:hypothetical protein